MTPDHQRGVDRGDLAVIDVQEAGAADRPSGGVHDHPEDMVEQQREHTAVHRTVAADVEPGEVATHLHTVGIEPAHRPRRQQQAAHPRQLRRSARRSLALGSLKRRQLRGQSFGVPGGVVPDVIAGVRGHRQILQPPHGCDESTETRPRAGCAVFREAAVMVVIGIELFWALRGIRHGRAARTSRRTMVWSRPGPTPMHEI